MPTVRSIRRWAEDAVPDPRVRLGLMVMGLVLITATIWYAVVEEFGWINAIYQTVITLSTVGFAEAEPLDTTGRLFTVIVIVIGVGAAFYTITASAELLFDRQLDVFGRRRMERQVSALSDHLILCGFGRVGANLAEQVATEVDIAVIEDDPRRVGAALERGLVVIEGDATDDQVLRSAALRDAKYLIAALPSDADNMFVVVSARQRNPGITIIARAKSEQNEAKLMSVGADRVVNPESIGSHRMATFALQPEVADFVDVVLHHGSLDDRLRAIAIAPGAELDGSSFGEARIREATGALVLALRTSDGGFLTNPGADLPLESGMKVIFIGSDDEARALGAKATGSRPDRLTRRASPRPERGSAEK